MSQSSPPIQAVRRLAASVEKEVDALAEACRRHDSLEIPLGGGLTPDAREPSFFQCHHGGAMIGCASAPPDRPVEVLGMVHPEHRREGIGRALLAAVAAGLDPAPHLSPRQRDILTAAR